MWLTSILSTGAGVTSVGLGALGTHSYESIRDRRRVRHGAVLLAIGSALAFASVGGAGVAPAVVGQLAVLEVTTLLMSALLVVRFSERESEDAVRRQRVVLSRPSRHGPSPRLSAPTPPAPRALTLDEALRVDAARPFSEVQRETFERLASAAPPPRRGVSYQPPA